MKMTAQQHLFNIAFTFIVLFVMALGVVFILKALEIL